MSNGFNWTLLEAEYPLPNESMSPWRPVQEQQVQEQQVQGEDKGSLLGRLFKGQLTEEDRKRMQMMDSGLQRLGNAFTPEGPGRNLASPFSGQIDVSGDRNSGHVGLGQLMAFLTARGNGRL